VEYLAVHEVYCGKVRGERCYVWHAIDQDADVVVREKNKRAAIWLYKNDERIGTFSSWISD